MILEDKKTVRVTRDYECSVKELFDHWRPDEMARWWSDLNTIELPTEKNAAVKFTWHGFDGEVQGEVEDYVEGKVWCFSWEHTPGGHKSHVRCEFEATEQGSRLTITDSNLENFDTAADHDHGWQYCLNDLDKAINKSPRDKGLVLERTFDAPIDMVFDAWTNPEHMNFWMNGKIQPDAVAKADLKVGGGFRMDYVDDQGCTHSHYGKYKEVSKPNRIVFSWLSDHSEGETEVSVDLKESDGKTHLKLVHKLFSSQKSADLHDEGWQSLWPEMEKILYK